MELILIKLASEIFLKGGNKRTFEEKLKKNMRKILKGIEYEFIEDQGRWFIKTEELEVSIERLRKIFGIFEIVIVKKMDLDIETIKKESLLYYNQNGNKTFKVETKRANKGFPLDSMQVNRLLGEYIIENNDKAKVEVKEPQLKIFVEIRNNAYIYIKKIKGENGLPYGMSGKTMLLLSGGIDSPVAGYMMGKRGVQIEAVYYHSHPYTSREAQEKVEKLAEILKTYTMQLRLHVVSFTKIQKEIMEKCREDELTIIMRRFMMRIADEIAKENNIHSITTGESISQVASQTMESLVVTDIVATRPVFRPLIATDKIDIMDIAKKIGTYETSILPYEDCCTIFVPKHPKTKPRLEVIEKSELNLDIDSLVDEAIKTKEIIDI